MGGSQQNFERHGKRSAWADIGKARKEGRSMVAVCQSTGSDNIQEAEDERRDMNRCDETIANYKKANKSAKRAVAKAKESAFKDLYDSLEEGQEGQQRAIRIAKQNNRESQDVY